MTTCTLQANNIESNNKSTHKQTITAAPATKSIYYRRNDEQETSISTSDRMSPMISHQTKQYDSKSSDIAAYEASLASNNLKSRVSDMSPASNNTINSTSNSMETSTPTKHQQSQQQQDPYYHNLFQWEQLVSKGVTRPLLINDLDFTDLRDEDDCDLLNTNTFGANSNNTINISNSNNNSNNKNNGILSGGANRKFNGEPLTISIPESTSQDSGQRSGTDHDSVDSGTSTGSPSSRLNEDAAVTTGNNDTQQDQNPTPVNAPPPMPPPPISPWFNMGLAGSRPQSEFMSTPSPQPFDSTGDFQSPNGQNGSGNNLTYSTYSRNSVCLGGGANGNNNGNIVENSLNQQFNSMQVNKLNSSLRAASSMSSLLFGNNPNGKYGFNKRRKTMKLFWKEVREDKSLLAKLTKKKTIWDEIKPAQVDTQKLEYLFESKAKDLSLSKSRQGLDGLNQKKVKITVLDAKRSNAINIGMTKLPPMRTIKNAILKMDSSIMNREGIEKILTTMMPSEEEKSRIIEAQLASPDTPLGTAEQFLLNLASISALEARLKLWAFQLDYAQIEKEVAEPLMDLKQAIEEIERSETFRVILGTLLAIGNFLNSTNAKGFQIDYLEKVPEVKDTVHKHSLLHHLCLFIHEKHPDLDSDLYSEFSAVNRASKVDYTEVAKNLKKMQQDCKASWDHLKIVAKHDGLANLMNTCGISTSNNSPSSNLSNSSSPSSTCDNNSSSISNNNNHHHQPRSAGKLNNLSKLSMITTVIGGSESEHHHHHHHHTQSSGHQSSKQLKIKVSDFLTDCAERIMVLMVVHRRVINRFQKLLVYLGCPSHQIKQTQPQQILKIINEFALEYRTKRERVREMLMRVQNQCHHHHHHGNGAGLGGAANANRLLRAKRWQLGRWANSQQSMVDSFMGCMGDQSPASSFDHRPCSTALSSCASPFGSGGGGGGSSSIDHVPGSYNSTDCSPYTQRQRRFVGETTNSPSANCHNNSSDRVGNRPLTSNQGNCNNQSSAASQLSDYSDYLYDRSSCCGSHLGSVTPVPQPASGTDANGCNANGDMNNRRAQSMSMSMYDIENRRPSRLSGGATDIMASMRSNDSSFTDSLSDLNDLSSVRERDEQLRQLLGVDKSFYGACKDLYQMKHWTSTMARPTRSTESQQGKLAMIRRMSGQQLERRESDEHEPIGKETIMKKQLEKQLDKINPAAILRRIRENADDMAAKREIRPREPAANQAGQAAGGAGAGGRRVDYLDDRSQPLSDNPFAPKAIGLAGLKPPSVTHFQRGSPSASSSPSSPAIVGTPPLVGGKTPGGTQLDPLAQQSPPSRRQPDRRTDSPPRSPSLMTPLAQAMNLNQLVKDGRKVPKYYRDLMNKISSPSQISAAGISPRYEMKPEQGFYTLEDILRYRGYTKLCVLDVGGFGTVCKAIRNWDGIAVALKEVDMSKQAYNKNEMKRELFVLQRVEGRNFIRCFEHFVVDNTLVIVMEFMAGGNLSEHLRSKNLSEDETWELFIQMASGIKHLHRLGISHRDIKLQNFLLDATQKVLKVADFGLSMVAWRPPMGMVYASSMCGTEPYMAPEILRRNRKNQRQFNPMLADVWAMGVCLYAMVTHMFPFLPSIGGKKMYELQINRRYTIPDRVRREMTEEIYDLIHRMLDPEASRRITSVGVMQHPWLNLYKPYRFSPEEQAIVSGKSTVSVQPPIVQLQPVTAAVSKSTNVLQTPTQASPATRL